MHMWVSTVAIPHTDSVGAADLSVDDGHLWGAAHVADARAVRASRRPSLATSIGPRAAEPAFEDTSRPSGRT
jgi:hypothetical protein